MPLTASCSQYNITGAVHEKLANEGYTDSPLLKYVSIAKLKEASFKNSVTGRSEWGSVQGEECQGSWLGFWGMVAF